MNVRDALDGAIVRADYEAPGSADAMMLRVVRAAFDVADLDLCENGIDLAPAMCGMQNDDGQPCAFCRLHVALDALKERIGAAVAPAETPS